MADIVSIGEMLIDFTPLANKGNQIFEQNPGGAPANMAVAAAHMGATAAFMGKVGNDAFGVFLQKTLNDHGVDISGLVRANDSQTTLAFVHLMKDGQREFNFYRGADQFLQEDEVNWSLIENARIVHISSLAFCSTITAQTTHRIIARAKAKNIPISYDANWRPMLWKDKRMGIRQLAVGNGFADIVKASEEELQLITGESDEKHGAQALLQQGVQMVLITRGAEGSAVYTQAAYTFAPAYNDIQAVDTTGAGDTCFGTFLAGMLKLRKAPDALNADELENLLRTSNAAAGLSVTKLGGISSIPTAAEVDAFLAAHPQD